MTYGVEPEEWQPGLEQEDGRHSTDQPQVPTGLEATGITSLLTFTLYIPQVTG